MTQAPDALPTDSAEMTVKEWIPFASAQIQEHPRMGIVIAFLSREPHRFANDGASAKDWTRLGQAQKASDSALESREDLDADFMAAAPAFIPGPAGESFKRYVKAELEPGALAREIIQGAPLEGVILARFNKMYGEGFSADSQFKGYLFGAALASEAALATLAAGPLSEQAQEFSKRMARGLSRMADDLFAYGVDLFAGLIKANGDESALLAAKASLLSECEALEKQDYTGWADRLFGKAPSARKASPSHRHGV